MTLLHTETPARLWGPWSSLTVGDICYDVLPKCIRECPHIRGTPDTSYDYPKRAKQVVIMGRELQRFMNFGERPAWLDDFERLDEDCAKSLSGGTLISQGPFLPVGGTRSGEYPLVYGDPSPQASANRRRLMDVLFG